jgi:hypothetical protein
MSITTCLYFPHNPEGLFKFLESVSSFETWSASKGKPEKVEVLLWVDNDDHKVSSEFYTLRKFIRKGLNIQVFVNPNLGSSDAVFADLLSKASGDQVLENKTYLVNLGDLLAGLAVFDNEEDVVTHEKA